MRLNKFWPFGKKERNPNKVDPRWEAASTDLFLYMDYLSLNLQYGSKVR